VLTAGRSSLALMEGSLLVLTIDVDGALKKLLRAAAGKIPE